MAVKKENERKEGLFRILVLIVSGIVLWLWMYLVAILALINLIITIFSGKRNRSIAIFSEPWNTETYKFFRYITAMSNKRPFPFTEVERISKFDAATN